MENVTVIRPKITVFPIMGHDTSADGRQPLLFTVQLLLAHHDGYIVETSDVFLCF